MFAKRLSAEELSTMSERQIASQIHRLTVARLAILPIGFGMTVAAGVNLIIGLLRLFVGDHGPIGAVVPLFLMAAAITGAAALAVPRIDRRILRLAQAASGRSACIAMLNLLNGLPLFSMRNSFEKELVRHLFEVDEDWWNAYSKRLQEVVDASLEDAKKPSWLHPAGGPWIPALLETIARCGRTEYIPGVEALANARKQTALPPPVIEAARSALESLKFRQQRDKEAATLLRPAPSSDETLLRPLQGGQTQDAELLLRPELAPDVPSTVRDPGQRVRLEPESIQLEDDPQRVTLHSS